MLGNVLQRFLFYTKNIILLPFKLGVYSFIAYLLGIKLDWLLSFFDIFKFNLPRWTYSKLIDLHKSWISWIKEMFKINSITTELNTPIPRLKRPTLINEVEPEINHEVKPETYLYLTKKEWIYISITIMTALAAYYGYTGGIPFRKSGEVEIDIDRADRPIRTYEITPTGIKELNKPDTWQDTLTDWTTIIIEKIKKPFNWFRSNS